MSRSHYAIRIVAPLPSKRTAEDTALLNERGKRLNAVLPQKQRYFAFTDGDTAAQNKAYIDATTTAARVARELEIPLEVSQGFFG